MNSFMPFSGGGIKVHLKATFNPFIFLNISN